MRDVIGPNGRLTSPHYSGHTEAYTPIEHVKYLTLGVRDVVYVQLHMIIYYYYYYYYCKENVNEDRPTL